MIHLMTPQPMILKMKKRLSDDFWLAPIATLSFISVAIIASYSLRTTSISWKYGMVEGKIPVVKAPSATPAKGVSLERNLPTLEQSERIMDDETVAVFLTRSAFYFGPISSFTENFSNVRNKFKIDHENGAPQADMLLSTLNLWAKAERRTLSKQVVFVPTSEIPMPIVIKVMSTLKNSNLFSHVVLGSGII